MAVESLARHRPGQYRLSIMSNHQALFENNPHLCGTDGRLRKPEGRRIVLEYPLINECNQRPISFGAAYCDHLGDSLGFKLPCLVNRPYLYLSDEEPASVPFDVPPRYALICSGTKRDYTTKGWGHHNYQALVNRLRGIVHFVQIGHQGDDHKQLDGAINLIGKTSVRDVVRLAFHADFGVGGMTFLQAVFAGLARPYVCLMGGREPLHWQHYPSQVSLSTVGTLPCCRSGSCFKSKVVPIDGDTSLCALPVIRDGQDPVPTCMEMIRPENVAERINDLYRFGTIDTKRSATVMIPQKKEKLFDGTPSLGVLVSTYASVPYIALQLASWQRWYGDVPLVVFDDGSASWRSLLTLCKRFKVPLLCNTLRGGHSGGDMAAFVHGLLWAEQNGIDLLVKFSRRWVPQSDWRPSLLEVAERTQYATYSNVCRRWSFGFRTECIGLHVPSWLPAIDEMRDRIAAKDIDLNEAVMHQMSREIHRNPPCAVNERVQDQEQRPHDSNAYGVWDWMPQSRHERTDRVLWHETHSPRDYLEAAERLGIGGYAVQDFERIETR